MEGKGGRFVNPAATTVARLLGKGAVCWPDKTFIDVDGAQLSYGESERRSRHLAHGLAALGIGRGDRVSVMLDTSLDMVLLWLAVTRMGAVMAPLNTAFRGEFLRHQLRDSGAGLIVVEGHYAERVTTILDQLPDLQRILVRGFKIFRRRHRL